MIEFDNTIVIIPASMAGSALPGHPMLDVNGRPLLLHAIETASAAKVGHVLVATTNQALAASMRKRDCEALVVAPQYNAPPVMAAQVLALRDAERRFQNIIIVPSHFPITSALSLRRCLACLFNKDVDVATLAIKTQNWRNNQVALTTALDSERELAYVRGASLAHPNLAPGFAHLPIFAWRRPALEAFVKTKVSHDDMAEILKAGLRCVAVKVDTMPFSVDTPGDLEALRRQLKV